MLDNHLLEGELVRLRAIDPESLAKALSGWGADSEFFRLLDWNPARRYSVKSTQEWLEKHMEDELAHAFAIHTLEDDRLIGDIGLDGVNWPHGDTFVGISIGEREFWGRGYGTDAMRVILRYAFHELNLQRVTLNVFAYNQRAVRSYEKAGFTLEGRMRGGVLREGRRWDVLYMGILREEWTRLQKV